MNRRHFIKCVAAGICGIPLLKPDSKPELHEIKLSVGRNVAPGAEHPWNAPDYVCVPKTLPSASTKSRCPNGSTHADAL